MSNNQFNDMALKNLPTKSTQYEVFDTKTPGLGFRVSPGGTKTFNLKYKMGGKSRRMKLGNYPMLSLKDARAKAKDALSVVSAGNDPQAQKVVERESYPDSLFPARAQQYIEHYAKRRTKQRTWSETERILMKQFGSRLSQVPVQKITRLQIEKILHEISDNNGHSAANHAYSTVKTMLKWCEKQGYLGRSPCESIERPAKPSSRERVLSNDELVAVWMAAETLGYPFGPHVQLQILTGQRRSEVSSLRWADIDLEKGIWTQPRERNKSGRTHEVPLSDQAMDIIKSLPRLHDELVFPARGKGNPVSGYSKWKRSWTN